MALQSDTANNGGETPTVSVVIPAYNAAATLCRAIDSVRAQHGCRLEIIVVDDGSTDETPGLLAGYGDALRVVRQANAGVGAARNAGIEAAAGAFVAFLDADDEWLADKLARQLELFVRRPDVDIVYCGAVFLKDGRPIPVTPVYLQGDLLPRLGHGNFIMTSSVLVRAACLRDPAARFATQLKVGEDYVLWLRLAAARRRFAAVPEALVRFVVGGREEKYPIEEYHKLYDQLAQVASDATGLSRRERARLLRQIRSAAAWERAMYLARQRAWSTALPAAARAWLARPLAWRAVARFLWHAARHR